MEPVLDHSSPNFFWYPKLDDGWRMVIDLSHLNNILEIPHFHVETVDGIMKALRRNKWVVSLDLKDANLHVPMAPSVQAYL